MADKINTGGGAAQEGDTDTGGGDWIGRDRNDSRWDKRTSADNKVNLYVEQARVDSDRQPGEPDIVWIMRVLRGDKWARQPGLIDSVVRLDHTLDAYMEKDTDWKRAINANILELQQRRTVPANWQVIATLAAFSLGFLYLAYIILSYLLQGGIRVG